MSKRYDPSQPRVPAGSSKGGQWVKDAETIDTNFAARKVEENRGLRIPLDTFGKKKEERARKDRSDTPLIPKKAIGFARLDTGNHDNHRKDLGYKDLKQYKQAAYDFWERGTGTLYYNPRRARFYKYDQQKYVVIDPEGIVHTFMPYNPKKFFTNIIKPEGLYEITDDR